MSLGLWGRLNLRWQAGIAILLPCSVLALFAALYMPQTLSSRARDGFLGKAEAVSRVVAVQLAGEGKFGDALSESQRKALEALKSEPDVLYLAAVDLTGGARVVHQLGTLPSNVGLSSQVRGCTAELSSDTVLVRCGLGEAQGALIVGYDTTAVRATMRAQQRLGFLFAGVALVLGVVMFLMFSAALATPVARVTEAAKVVASGDVTIDAVEVAATGEIHSMAMSFNEMLANLRALVGQMVSLTARLSDASKGLMTASQDQEHVTNQQAAYAQEIAATFEELSRTAEQISNSTDVVELAAGRTNEAVADAKAVVAQVVAGIQNIRNESKEVAESISRLNSDLQEVSKIAQVINTVAERSDLLALNAALEGTKAGEVGRGFSLVAAEMRKLAENVSGSARDIGRIVENIQESGNAAMAKASVGVSASDKGVKVAEQVTVVFERIVELARGTTEAAQQIAIATRQQQQSSDQAVQGARDVANLVKQGVDATGRTTKIAQDLQSVAQALSDVTGRFKVARD